MPMVSWWVVGPTLDFSKLRAAQIDLRSVGSDLYAQLKDYTVL